MTLATTILAFLAAILVLVTVHELGHYLVARWCGVKIVRFSVGFGHALISRRFGIDQTEWVLAAIPLGGYVRMLDSREGDVPPELRHRSFDAQPVLTRMAIVFAGPLVNLVLAAFIYAGLSMYGVAEWRPVIGEPAVGSRAAESGLVAGSTVLAVNDDPVSTWSEFQLKVLDQALAKADAVTLTLRNPVGERQSRMLELRSEARGLSDADVLAQLGLRLFRPPIAPVIGTLQPGKPAANAGLQAGDRIQTVGGKPVQDWTAFVELVRQSSDEFVNLSLLRGATLLTVSIRPEQIEEGGKKIARIGVGPLLTEEPDTRFQITVRHDLVSALGEGIARTASGALLSLRMMGKMLVGELSWRNLSGPVTIADYAGKSARISLVAYLSFLAMISISLGVLNLLPIPLLDGGHLMYYSAELLTGAPVPEKIAEWGQKVGILVLGCLMAFAFFNDLNRLFSG
jgi:regulator of sigma E protease